VKHWSNLAVPTNIAILGFAVLLTAGLFVTRTIFAPGDWLLLHLFEPAKLLAYVLMFIVGIIAYRSNWLQQIPAKIGKIWGVVAIISLLCTPIVITVFGNGQDLWAMGFNSATLATSAWDAFLCVSLCVSLPIFFRQKIDVKSKVLQADDAFGAYLLHPFVLLLIQGIFLSIDIHPFVKFVIVAAIGILLSFSFIHMFRKIPRVNKII
jgi:surface polysaccharide O-acyltransferase-like enzyme